MNNLFKSSKIRSHFGRLTDKFPNTLGMAFGDSYRFDYYSPRFNPRSKARKIASRCKNIWSNNISRLGSLAIPGIIAAGAGGIGFMSYKMDDDFKYKVDKTLHNSSRWLKSLMRIDTSEEDKEWRAKEKILMEKAKEERQTDAWRKNDYKGHWRDY